jgi:glycosyltransferase involved in cell wall biosynthesis
MKRSRPSIPGQDLFVSIERPVVILCRSSGDAETAERARLQEGYEGARNEMRMLTALRFWRVRRPLRALNWWLSALRRPRQSPLTDARCGAPTAPAPPKTSESASVGALGAKAPIPRARELGWVRQNLFPGLRVVIVTPDIHGPICNGGIGTAFAALAQQLAEWGVDVTIAYALGMYTESEPVSYWREHYAGLGVKFLALDETQLEMFPALGASRARQLPWRVYRWLERNEKSFDLAIFPEWMGLAYYVLTAKGQGLAFNDLVVAINTHSPESWATEGNRALPDSLDAVERDFMERESVRRADWVISPSRYLIDWMRGRKWVVPDQLRIIQNLMPNVLEPSSDSFLMQAQPATTIVFFGRLEVRKGLKLFCDAVGRMEAGERSKLQSIRFLGKAGVVSAGFNSLTYIAERTRDWGVRVDVVTDKNKDQALSELLQPGVLAVIASLSENSPYTVLECLHHGVHFVASRVGGIAELVHPDDADACLFAPTPQALSNCLQNAMTYGSPSVRMAQPRDGVREQWKGWLQEVTQTRRAPVLPADVSRGDIEGKPLVSICLVHYNRPQYLAQALASIRTQSYSNIEVVLVDDGSPSAIARQFLDNLEPEFRARNWQIIRQTNSYLGAARNRAAEAARGQYLMFMDDDNIAMPDEVETFVSAALRSGADILTCMAAPFTDEPEATPSRLWLPLGGASGAGIYHNVFGDANALWKRDEFLRHGGHTTDYGVGHEDWELFAEAVLTGALLEVVPRPLFWYRVSADSMLRTGNKWEDHARSARAYLRHDPSGLGMAAAYAAFLQRSREVDEKRWARENTIGLRLFRAIRMASDQSLRAKFVSAWHRHGFRNATNRALVKAGMSVQAMRRGESSAKHTRAASRGRLKKPERLDLRWEQGPPAISVFIGRVSGEPLSDSMAADFALIGALAAAGAPVRVIATDVSPGPSELQFRMLLQSRFSLPRKAQCRLQVLDGAAMPALCSKDDVFVTTDQNIALWLAKALGECATPVTAPAAGSAALGPWPSDGRGLAAFEAGGSARIEPIQDFVNAAQRLVEDFQSRQSSVRDQPPYGQGFRLISDCGLGYRVLKPVAADWIGRRACLFVHFDPDDRIDPYVVHYLSALKRSGVDPILISSSELDAAAVAEVEPILAGTVCRQNLGRDFSGWALALELFPQLLNCDEVIIANDSVYGPVGDLGTLFGRMQAVPWDVWGVAESLEIERHFQSWFVCFRQAALRSETFRSFWGGVLPLNDKTAIIENYEVPIARMFKSQGFEVGAVVGCGQLKARVGNPTLHPWRNLLDLGVPFVKVQLLRDNPLNTDLSGWISEVSRRGYPPRLILDHLRRVAGKGAAALQTR